jgi:transposase-like protein
MKLCKYCNKDTLVKYGTLKDLRQIYKCKSCDKYFREGIDNRKKY